MNRRLPKDYAASENSHHWREKLKVQPLVAQIGWTHNLEEAVELVRKIQENLEGLGV